MNRCLRRRAPLRFAVALPILACILLGSPRAYAEDFREGTDVFRGLLGTFLEPPYRATTLDGIDQVASDPAHTLVIITGNAASLDSLADRFGGGRRGLAAFLDRGGALLVATDRQSPPVFRETFGCEVPGDLVETDGNNPKWAYKAGQSKAEHFLLVDVRPPSPDEFPLRSEVFSTEPPLFRDLTHIATNQPSFLRCPRRLQGDSALRILATLPPVNHFFFRGQRFSDIWLPFAVGGQWGSGRVLLLADQDVFLNSMMQPDTNNLDFSIRALQWLMGPPGSGRTRILYIENGNVRTDFDFAPKAKKRKRLWEDIDTINRVLAQAEREDVLDRFLGDKIPHWLVIYIATILLTLLLVLYAFHRLSTARWRTDPGTTAPANGLSRLAPTSGGVVLRAQHMLRDSNLYEPARTVARQFFTLALGAPPAPGEAAADQPPRVLRRDGTAAPRPLGRLVEYLWRLAFGREPQRVTPPQFANLLAQLRGLEAALATRDVQLQLSRPER